MMFSLFTKLSKKNQFFLGLFAFILLVSCLKAYSQIFYSSGITQIYALATQGIYLYVLFFFLIYMSIHILWEQGRFMRRIFYTLLACSISQFLGSFWHHQVSQPNQEIITNDKKYTSHFSSCTDHRVFQNLNCIKEKYNNLPIFFTLHPQEAFTVLINFQSFPESFRRDLEKAVQGKTVLKVSPYIVFSNFKLSLEIPPTPTPITASPDSNKFIFSPQQIESFLKYKKLSFSFTNSTSPPTPILPHQLMILNPKYSPLYRVDEAFVGNKKLSFTQGKTFIVVFYFETLDGKPIRVFY